MNSDRGAGQSPSVQRRAGALRLPRPTPRPRDRVLILTVSLILGLLLLCGDDRHVGLVADGRQMIRTAVALVETGTISQPVGRDFTIERAGGDAVSRFGMAMSLLQVPAAWAAGPVEARLGPGRSQALFLLVPWLAIDVAAGAAGMMTRRLGGGDVEVAAAVVLASVGSPLGSYALLEFSEPVQAAVMALGLAAALAATRRALTGAGVGAALPRAAWGAFELMRFGTFFGGYPDDRFTHPWLDGAWRLLVGPTRGLLLFWRP